MYLCDNQTNLETRASLWGSDNQYLDDIGVIGEGGHLTLIKDNSLINLCWHFDDTSASLLLTNWRIQSYLCMVDFEWIAIVSMCTVRYKRFEIQYEIEIDQFRFQAWELWPISCINLVSNWMQLEKYSYFFLFSFYFHKI